MKNIYTTNADNALSDKAFNEILNVGKERYPALFKPLKIGLNSLKNRLYFASTGVDLATPTGCFSPAMQDFYNGFLKSGVGHIVLSNATVSPESRLQDKGLCLYTNKQSDALSPLLTIAEQHSIPIAIMLQHYGGQAPTYTTGKPVLTPSGMTSNYISKYQDSDYHTKIMTLDDIDMVKQQFVDAAILACRTGAKLIQLHAANGYLLSSFLSPYSNRRQDSYGGSEENRARLLLEIINEVRSELNGKADLTVHLGIDDMMNDNGLQYFQLRETIEELNQSGIATLTCFMGNNKTLPSLLQNQKSFEYYLCKGVKQITAWSQVPVGFSGFVDNLKKAQTHIEQGIADFVGMSRALFADNDLIIKSIIGDEKNIQHCLWDNQCLQDKSDPRRDRVYCCVNPRYLRPRS